MNASGDVFDNPQLLRERSKSTETTSTPSVAGTGSGPNSAGGGAKRRINSDRHAPKEQRYAELEVRMLPHLFM